MKKIVSNLRFNDKHQLVCKGKNGKFCPVFKKQGRLDGACATYSVIMNLLILSLISDTDTHWNAEYKTKEIKKLFKVFCNDNGMHRAGQTFYKITKMLRSSFGTVIDVQHTATTCSEWDTIDMIVSVVNKMKIPVIMSISDGKEWGHAMLVVGYEKEKDTITRLFCLDPSGDYIHGNKRWNASIDIKKERKNPFAYISSLEGEKLKRFVSLADIMILTKL